MRKRKMMRRKKKLMNELEFYPRQTCFIYKYTLMGLCKGKVQSISTGFYILPRADDKEASTYQEKRYVQKKREREKNYLSRGTAYLVLDSGAYIIRKEEKNH
jgi:hypothetical protein